MKSKNSVSQKGVLVMNAVLLIRTPSDVHLLALVSIRKESSEESKSPSADSSIASS